MTIKTVTSTELIDDIDGSRADRTISFAVDVTSYQIELSKKNATAFDKALKPYLAAARKTRRSPSRTTGTRRTRTSETRYDLAAIRDWARTNGHTVADRGHIPAAIIDAYHGTR